jgi:hypothetical protein
MSKGNTGDCNTGNRNTGNRNTGDWNTGYCNTGNCNTGNRNTGNRNTGYWNTGNCNTGNRNTGNRNTGDCNTGNWNTGNWNTGYFNVDTPDTIRVFGKECKKEDWDNCNKPSFIYFELTEFIEDSDMTDKEKQDNPEYGTIGGYVKSYTYHEAWRKAWDNASDEDKELLYKLPNFDSEIFKQISGIDVNEEQKHEELTVADIEKLLGKKIKIVK